MNICNFDPFEKLFFIGGPCAIESLDSSLRHAEAIKKICERLGIPFVYKSSYDKANRLSYKSFRGVGMEEGLDILSKTKERLDISLLTDVHTSNEVVPVGEVVDILQLPAFLCRQTDLLMDMSKTGKPVNIKKGQFLSPWDMKHLVDKARSTGNEQIILTERGTTFGYGYLVNDMRSIPIMKESGFPVVIDAGHSVQLPGQGGGKSSGMRDMIPTIAKAGIAAGANGLYLETHFDPDKAPSDGPNMLPIDQLEGLLTVVLKIYEVCK